MPKVTKRSPFTGVETTIEIPYTQAQLENWEGGMLIQNAMPNLTPDEREFLLTGITAEEWENSFGEKGE